MPGLPAGGRPVGWQGRRPPAGVSSGYTGDAQLSAGPLGGRRRHPVAYDEGLAQRIREALEAQPNISEKKMFGGLAFLLRGNMCVGVVGDQLMVRVGAEA